MITILLLQYLSTLSSLPSLDKGYQYYPSNVGGDYVHSLQEFMKAEGAVLCAPPFDVSKVDKITINYSTTYDMSTCMFTF